MFRFLLSFLTRENFDHSDDKPVTVNKVEELEPQEDLENEYVVACDRGGDKGYCGIHHVEKKEKIGEQLLNESIQTSESHEIDDINLLEMFTETEQTPILSEGQSEIKTVKSEEVSVHFSHDEHLIIKNNDTVVKDILPEGKVELVMKSQPLSVCKMFKRELFMRDIILPTLKAFTSGKLSKDTPILCLNGNESVEKNLEQFRLWNRLQTMDLDHMIVLVTSLGRWHGCNMAFQDKNPEEYRRWKNELSTMMPEYFSSTSILNMMIKNIIQVLKTLKRFGYHQLIELYMRKLGCIGQVLFGSGKYLVVGFHTDFWTDCFHFRYQLKESIVKPNDLVFSNMQLPMMDSPIRDLSYLIYGYSDSTTLHDFNFLLHAYHHSLSTTITELGGDSDNIFSFRELKNEWETLGMFGVFMSVFEMFDGEDILEHGTEIEDPLLAKRICEDCNMKVIDAFIHYGKHFL